MSLHLFSKWFKSGKICSKSADEQSLGLKIFVGLPNTKIPSKSISQPLTVDSLEDRTVPSGTNLGLAGNFNAFIFQNANMQNSDIQGRFAIGQNANLMNYGVGTQLSNSHGGRDDLIVGGNLNFTNGQVFNGNIAYDGSSTLNSVGIPNGTAKHAYDINFGYAETQLMNDSAAWGARAANGTFVNQWGGLTLTGTNSTLNVFNLTTSDLSNLWGITIKAPAGSSVLVNVSGTGPVSLQYMGFNLVGTDASHVVFNFTQATNITLSGIGFQGSILAPYANVEFNNGNLTGTLVANNLCGTGEFHEVVPQFKIGCGCDSGSLVGQVLVEDSCDPGTMMPVHDATVILTGHNAFGSVNLTSHTSAGGYYSFTNLYPGTYTATVILPNGDTFVSASIGDAAGYVSGDSVVGIIIGEAQAARGYNFTLRGY